MKIQELALPGRCAICTRPAKHMCCDNVACVRKYGILVCIFRNHKRLVEHEISYVENPPMTDHEEMIHEAEYERIAAWNLRLLDKINSGQRIVELVGGTGKPNMLNMPAPYFQ